MINIGQYIETAINWLTEHFASFFDALSMGIGGFIDGFQHVLFGIPFYITIAVLAALAWFKSGKGTPYLPSWVYCLFTAWAFGKKRCRHWHWYFLPLVWHCF